jgi:hypothetical protein
LNIVSTYLTKYIDLKVGFFGALLMGGIVFFINIKHGWVLSTTAGLKQGIYTFFFGGVIVKLLEYCIIKIKNQSLSIPLSVFSISLLTTFLVFLVHSLRGTPEPFLSTIPTIIMAPPAFWVLAIRFQKNHEKK